MSIDDSESESDEQAITECVENTSPSPKGKNVVAPCPSPVEEEGIDAQLLKEKYLFGQEGDTQEELVKKTKLPSPAEVWDVGAQATLEKA